MFRFIKSLFSSPKPVPKMAIPAPANTPSGSDEPQNHAKDLLKQASALKKEKKYDLACEKLQEAYQAEGAESLTIKERLRLPMYLQLAKRNEEGWKELNRLTLKHIDAFSQVEIANQMRIFQQNENKYIQAVEFAIWTLCKEIERDRFMQKTNEPFNEESMAPESIAPRISTLLKKAKKTNLTETISKQVSDYLLSNQHYDIRAIRDLLTKTVE